MLSCVNVCSDRNIWPAEYQYILMPLCNLCLLLSCCESKRSARYYLFASFKFLRRKTSANLFVARLKDLIQSAHCFINYCREEFKCETPIYLLLSSKMILKLFTFWFKNPDVQTPFFCLLCSGKRIEDNK